MMVDAASGSRTRAAVPERSPRRRDSPLPARGRCGAVAGGYHGDAASRRASSTGNSWGWIAGGAPIVAATIASSVVLTFA